MELRFASRMKDYEEGIFQVLNEKRKNWCGRGERCTTFP